MISKLSASEVEQALNVLNSGLEEKAHWTIKDGKLFRKFVFSDFASAFAWMTQMAIWAEKQDHHPEWFNVYDKVEVYLTTHDADGISQRDFRLAEKMNR